MTTTSFPVPGGQPAVARTDGWMAKRGVLLVFLQIPVAALVFGYGLDVVSLPVASFAVFVSSAAFPAWVSYRTTTSDDPAEPVHHLHRYAIRALAAVAAFTGLLLPVLLAAGVAVRRLWSDLGSALTAEPATGWWSLIAGAVVYGLVAVCLAISLHVIARRPKS